VAATLVATLLALPLETSTLPRQYLCSTTAVASLNFMHPPLHYTSERVIWRQQQ